MKLQDKVAVVTGSTRGIGEAIVRLFHKEGAKVVITGRDETKGLSIRKELVKDKSMAEFSNEDTRCIFIVGVHGFKGSEVPFSSPDSI